MEPGVPILEKLQDPAATFSHLANVAASGDAQRFGRELDSSADSIRNYLGAMRLEGAPEGLTGDYVGDALYRFLNTLQMVPLPAGRRILEFGSNPYFFHVLLKKIFPGSTLQGANFFDHNIFSTDIGNITQRVRNSATGESWEFTYPLFNVESLARYPFPTRSVDLVFFCETLEHLVVDPLSVFRKIRRLLVPGGYLVITLPNAVRMANVAAMLDGRNFFDLYHPTGVHGRHNREFTLSEMKVLLDRNGFEVERAETRDRFDYRHTPIQVVDYSGPPADLARDHAATTRALELAGGSLEDRGDNLYLVARRPSPTAGRDPRPVGSTAECPPAPASDPSRVIGFLDEVRDADSSLTVSGWAFLTDEEATPDEWIDLVLTSVNRCFASACSRHERPDVVARYRLDRPDPGFTATIDKRGLPKGRYRLGVRLGGGAFDEGFLDLSRETTVP